MEQRLTREQRDQLAKLCAVTFDEPMSAHTVFGVGGPADAFIEVDGVMELKKVMGFAVERRVACTFIGAGSNVLVKDGGIRGIVLRLTGEFKETSVLHAVGDEVFVAAGAAVQMPQLVRWSLEEGFRGLEIMTGVPGVVGGNLMMNAGTRSGSMSDIVDEITILDRELREMTLKAKSLRFEYRKLKLPRTACILRAVIKLRRARPDEEPLKLGELLGKRRATQPTAAQSCGCVFKNPEKVSAGQLIEEAGLKGVRVGQARVSTLHANFIVNEGKASAREILVLIGLIRDRVKQASGIHLEPEVVILGEDR